MIVGIDPGKNGGIAILYESGKVIAEQIPDTITDLYTTFRDMQAYRYDSEMAFCLIEKVGPMPKQGVRSMFSFGDIYGQLKMLVTSFQIPMDYVTPQTWMKGLCIPKRGDKTKTQHKTLLLEKAQSLYPKVFDGLNKTNSLKISDAILIVEYARRNIF